MKEKTLREILAYYGMPEENIVSAITQIAQGYGACRYLEGVAIGAEATGKGSGFVPLCTAKIVWKDEGGGRAFPSFEEEMVYSHSLLPSLAMEVGEEVGIYMRRINYDGRIKNSTQGQPPDFRGWQLGTNKDPYQTYLDGSMCEEEFFVDNKDFK